MVIGMQWIIFIGVAVVSWLVQMNLQNKFKKYSQIPTGNGMTGADVARKMLNDNGIYDVQVTCTPGHLTDHYNPDTPCSMPVPMRRSPCAASWCRSFRLLQTS